MSASGEDGLLLYAVGDVAPDREDPRECFALVRDELRRADIGFCQLEVNLTERGARLPQVRHTHRAKPSTARALAEAGFSVVSFAGNHCLDWGPDGFHDTIEHLRAAQLKVVGVGDDIAEAREPVLLDQAGVPAFINRDAQPEIVAASDPRFEQIVRYVQRVSTSQGLSVRLQPEGDVVWVCEGA